MLFLLKKLLIILFSSSLLSFNSYSNELKRTSLLILDKSASTKYILNFNDKISFRDITFELVACEESIFDKYIDQIALIKIHQKDANYRNLTNGDIVEVFNKRGKSLVPKY